MNGSTSCRKWLEPSDDRSRIRVRQPVLHMPTNKARPLDCLVLEAFAWSPHLETAGEIAITKATAGSRIGFAFVDVHNPDDIASTPRHFPLGFRSRRNKVCSLEQKLAA